SSRRRHTRFSRDWSSDVCSSDLEFQAHSANLGFKFYTGKQFPAEYQGDAIIAQHGSWNRSQPVGYQLVRVKFDEQNRVTGTEVRSEERRVGKEWSSRWAGDRGTT